MIEKLQGSLSKRPVSARGPISSADYNDFFDEVLADFNSLINSWNQYLQPLLDSLPAGNSRLSYDERDFTQINPFRNGFDGSQLFMDQTATLQLDDGYYYDASLLRPLTVKEAVEKIKDDLAVRIDSLDNQISQIDAATGLTTYMKSRIGANIFNEEDISSSDSLDGLTQQYMRWFSQLAADIWNEGSSVGTLPTHFTYSTTGAQTKTDSIMDLINDLETAVAPIPALQAAVAALSGVTADLTYIETIIGNITGMPAHGSDWDDTPNYPGWGNFTLYDAAGRIQTHIDDTGNVHDLLWDDATLVNGAGDTIQDELDLIYGPAGYLIAIKNILWPTDPNIANLSSLITNFTGTTYLGIYTNYHDAIVELDTVIDDIQDQIDAINAIVGPLVTEVDDHEIRIDVLEADALKIRMYSLAPQEVVDGFRVSFTWAERVLYEELPLLGGGYDWPYGSTIDVELEYTPVHAPGNYFTESLIFVTDVYDLGRLPLYPGEYVVIDQVHFNTYAVGEVGHLYVIPDFTVHVPGYISYYTPGLYDLQYYTIEVFVNGVLQAPFRDWGPGSSPDVNSIIFDTAPIVGSTIAFHGTKS